MKTHTGDYHECPYDRCDKRYCQEYKLRAHILKEHKKCSKVTKKSMKVVGTGVSGKVQATLVVVLCGVDGVCVCECVRARARGPFGESIW